MGYIRVKNDRVEDDINNEKKKILTEKDKYAHFVKDLELKLDESEKEQRIAGVL